MLPPSSSRQCLAPSLALTWDFQRAFAILSDPFEVASCANVRALVLLRTDTPTSALVALSVALESSIPTMVSEGLGVAIVAGSAPPGSCALTSAGFSTTTSAFSSYTGNPKAVGGPAPTTPPSLPQDSCNGSGNSGIQDGAPLPPCKLSFNSPRSVSAPATSPTTNTMLIPPEPDQSYPPLTDISTIDGARRAQGHVAASSISSFHSVSLSSDGDDSAPFGRANTLTAFPMEREWTGTGTEDGESLDESFKTSLRLPPSSPPLPSRLVPKSHRHPASPHSP